MEFALPPADRSLDEALRRKIDNKTKPLGALGRLEDLALQIGRVRGSLTPSLNYPHLVVFSGDHGAAKGHRLQLAALGERGVEPLLDLDLRLGEGAGAALAWPLAHAACALLNEMASFESAGVSQAS